MAPAESVSQQRERGRFHLSAAGVTLACAYVALTPIMLQDSFRPMLPGFLAGAQLADLLGPFLVLWILLDARHSLSAAPEDEARPWHAILVGLVLANLLIPLAAFALQSESDPATPSKQAYLGLVLLFFARVGCVPKASLVILWASLLTLLVAGATSLAAYGIFALSGRAEFAVQEGANLMFFGRPLGALLGTMKPTPKLFGTYLFVMQLALFIGRDHLGPRFWRVLTSLVVVCGILTFTRPGLYAACCAAAAFGLRSRSAALRWMWLPVVLAVITIASVTSVCDANLIHWDAPGETCTSTSLVHLKRTALVSWLEAPILGPGLTRFSEAWSEAGSEGRLPGHLAGTIAETPNCSYLHILLASGLMGLAGWLGLLGWPFAYLWHSRKGREERLFLALWFVLFGLVMLDLTIVHFRFLYFLIPVLPLVPLRPLPAPPRDDL